MQVNMEFGGDAVTQVSTAPAHHAIGLEVRAVFYPLRHFAPLGLGQTRLTPRPVPVREPRQAFRNVANNPVAQRLPVHPTGLRGHPPRMPIQHHGNGQNAPRLLGVSRPRCLRPQLRNTQILACNLDCRHAARSANQ